MAARGSLTRREEPYGNPRRMDVSRPGLSGAAGGGATVVTIDAFEMRLTI